jgi:ubiquinone biosynthesis protein
MRWIRTTRQLGQAVKNVQRLRHIVGVFARHGFADVVNRTNLTKYLPGRLTAFATQSADQSVAERLKSAFEELGPTFVKLGQLLSTRPDVIPENFIEEFTKLQDDVLPISFESIKAVVEQELGKPLDQLYATFNVEPLAAASISQVHAATLHSGEQVVVKVQRPDIDKVIETDTSILAFIARLLERYVPETKMIGPVVIVDEFFRTISYELDFYVEANNMAKIAQNMASVPEIVIPEVYKSLSTTRVLTLAKLDGIRVNDLAALDRAGIDRKAVVKVGARAFFKSVLIDGLFHGDLHGGNMFVLPGNKLGIIDFGIVGRLSQKSRDQLATMVMALLTEDFENLCYQYAELGAASHAIDFDSFQREVRNTLSPYMGLNMSELNSGKVLIEATKIAAKYDIKIPGDWMIVFKAILTTEGMGRTLDPEFDMLETGQDLVKELVKNQYSMQRLSKEMLWVAKDALSLLHSLPRQIRWMMNKFSANDFALEVRIPELSKVREQLDANGRRTSLSIMASGLFVASALALQFQDQKLIWGYPLPSVVLLSAGAFLFLRVWFK